MQPLVIIILFAAAFVAWVMWTQAIGSGWGPTPSRKVRIMLEMCNVKSSDTVYDLGCGDGRIIVAAARLYGARAVGIEADPLRFLISLIRVRLSGVQGRVRVVHGDFFKVNLSEATVVTLFLQQRTNRKLEGKLISELRPGSRVVSYVWKMEDWSPVLVDDENEIYVYEIGVSEKVKPPK